MPPGDFRLLLVTDRTQTRGRPLPSVIREAVKSGVPAVQLRERDLLTSELLLLAQTLQAITRPSGVPLIVNDRLDLALALELDGVHLRASSLPAAVVRRLAGPQRVVGVSTHSLEDVRRANEEGADYVVFGPVFDTPSKRPFGPPLGLDALAAVCAKSAAPVFAIGGVTPSRAREARQAGAHGVAVIGAILTQDDVRAATAQLLAAVSST